MLDVGIIIPAHNEASTIGSMAAACAASPLAAQVIVVDDGSIDGTADAARRTGVEVVIQRPNRGKAQALHAGIQRLRTKLWVMLDADLIDFRPRHVAVLAKPVLYGECDMTVGSVGRGAANSRRQIVLNLSGQRCFPKRLWGMMLAIYPLILTMRFGIELGLNRIGDNLRLRRRAVDLDGVYDRCKNDKYGPVLGSVGRWRMWAEITATSKYPARPILGTLASGRSAS